MQRPKQWHQSWRNQPRLSSAIRPRLVVIGAGFAGWQVIQQLRHQDLDVILIDRQPYSTFQPLLHQVAAGQLEPSQVAYPIRSQLRKAKNLRFIMAEVQAVDTAAQQIRTDQGDISYDFLVLATGSRTHFRNVAGAAQHTYPLKTVDDAIALQQQILQCFEQALQESDPAQQRHLLTFVIVGGGATGVELASALADWIRYGLVKDYAQVDCRKIRVVLLHSGDRLLSHFPPKLQAYVHRKLKSMGVELRLNQRVQQVEPDTVWLQRGESLVSATVVWTAGAVATLPAHNSLHLQLNQRVEVKPTLQTLAHPNVYAIGDAAAWGAPERPAPQLAAVAVQQGKAAARNILRQIQGRHPRPFRYRDWGKMVILGRYAAAIDLGRWQWSGPGAWLLWLMIHWVLLKGSRQRWMTLLHWFQSYGWHEYPAQPLFKPSFRAIAPIPTADPTSPSQVA